jgi:hypothetical protein
VEQRRLRLGDILDDYCPRERRVTNHAIVAMIEDDIKQTRCTTCDAEHAYKGARTPRRRKKDTPTLVAPDAAAATAAIDEPADESYAGVVEASADTRDVDDRDEPQPETNASADAPDDEPPPAIEDGPVHRPLIRATLPRPEGQKTERPLPDFTVRHANSRGGKPMFRTNGRAAMRAHGNGNGNRGPGRFAGSRQGGRGGPQAGFRSGPPRHGGGKKRSR